MFQLNKGFPSNKPTAKKRRKEKIFQKCPRGGEKQRCDSREFLLTEGLLGLWKSKEVEE